ncbi:MAG: hypothetical protein HYX48_07885 [Chlamydiales bacterium]|nr:hypothetical protein [Chlamydiales bacterium]
MSALFFTLPGLFVGNFCSDDTKEAIRQFTWVGTKLALLLSLASLCALVINVYQDRMAIGDVAPKSMAQWAVEGS